MTQSTVTSAPPRLIIDGWYPTTVMYDRSFQELLDAGHYDWVGDVFKDVTFESILVKVRSRGVLIKDIALARFDVSIGMKKALAIFKENGLRPLRLWEMLAFGIQYPDPQYYEPIVGLGFLETGARKFALSPCLSGYFFKKDEYGKFPRYPRACRNISMSNIDARFGIGCRFGVTPIDENTKPLY
jgi:hypothetical protein